MAAMDEARTTADTAADHVADHNLLHVRYNQGEVSKFFLKSYTATAPHANWTDMEVVYWTGSDWAVRDMVLTNGIVDPLYSSATHDEQTLVWGAAPGAVVIRIDADSAVEGSVVRVWMISSHSGGGLAAPTAIKLEYSDNDSSWTTVQDNTGLTTTHTSGSLPQCLAFDFDVTASGSHRYWRVTATQSTSLKWIGMTQIEMW